MSKIGFVSLIQSAKGTLSLLVLITSVVLCALGKLDGNSFSIVMGVVSSIFMYTNHKVDIATIQAATPDPVPQSVIDSVKNSIVKQL
jgi:hypothetical protein